MIIKTYKCDLCKKEVVSWYDGYRLSYSGDGCISLHWLNEETRSESVICLHCVDGLEKWGLNHKPKHPDE